MRFSSAFFLEFSKPCSFSTEGQSGFLALSVKISEISQISNLKGGHIYIPRETFRSQVLF